jgi:hypothetical protein
MVAIVIYGKTTSSDQYIYLYVLLYFFESREKRNKTSLTGWERITDIWILPRYIPLFT